MYVCMCVRELLAYTCTPHVRYPDLLFGEAGNTRAVCIKGKHGECPPATCNYDRHLPNITHTHTCTHTYAHTQHAHTHTRTHTRTHTYTHTHIRAQTRTHSTTPTCGQGCVQGTDRSLQHFPLCKGQACGLHQIRLLLHPLIKKTLLGALHGLQGVCVCMRVFRCVCCVCMHTFFVHSSKKLSWVPFLACRECVCLCVYRFTHTYKQLIPPFPTNDTTCAISNPHLRQSLQQPGLPLA